MWCYAPWVVSLNRTVTGSTGVCVSPFWLRLRASQKKFHTRVSSLKYSYSPPRVSQINGAQGSKTGTDDHAAKNEAQEKRKRTAKEAKSHTVHSSTTPHKRKVETFPCSNQSCRRSTAFGGSCLAKGLKTKENLPNRGAQFQWRCGHITCVQCAATFFHSYARTTGVLNTCKCHICSAMTSCNMGFFGGKDKNVLLDKALFYDFTKLKDAQFKSVFPGKDKATPAPQPLVVSPSTLVPPAVVTLPGIATAPPPPPPPAPTEAPDQEGAEEHKDSVDGPTTVTSPMHPAPEFSFPGLKPLPPPGEHKVDKQVHPKTKKRKEEVEEEEEQDESKSDCSFGSSSCLVDRAHHNFEKDLNGEFIFGVEPELPEYSAHGVMEGWRQYLAFKTQLLRKDHYQKVWGADIENQKGDSGYDFDGEAKKLAQDAVNAPSWFREFCTFAYRHYSYVFNRDNSAFIRQVVEQHALPGEDRVLPVFDPRRDFKPTDKLPKDPPPLEEVHQTCFYTRTRELELFEKTATWNPTTLYLFISTVISLAIVIGLMIGGWHASAIHDRIGIVVISVFLSVSTVSLVSLFVLTLLSHMGIDLCKTPGPQSILGLETSLKYNRWLAVDGWGRWSLFHANGFRGVGVRRKIYSYLYARVRLKCNVLNINEHLHSRVNRLVHIEISETQATFGNRLFFDDQIVENTVLALSQMVLARGFTAKAHGV